MQTNTLERYLNQYRPEQITRSEQITIGISNEAFAVTCASGSRYVIRIIHLQTVESVRAEVLIQQALKEHGISTPVYLQLVTGEFVGHDQSSTFTVAEHISGTHPEHTSIKLVENMGAVMAKLHTVLEQDQIAIGYNTGQWLNPRNVTIDIARCNPKTQKRLQPIVDATVHILDERLPMAIIHGDLSTNNIFAKGDEVTTIFDFETTEYAPRILDIAYSYLSFVCDEELEPSSIYKALRAGYDEQAKTKLTAAEEAAFDTAMRYASAATSAWCFSRGYDEYGEKFLQAGTQPL